MRLFTACLLGFAVALASCGPPPAPVRNAAQRFAEAITRIAFQTGGSADDVGRSLRNRLGVVDDVTDDAAARAERIADETAWIDDAASRAVPTMEHVGKQIISATACDAIEYRLDRGVWPEYEELSAMVFDNLVEYGVSMLQDEQSALIAEVEEHLVGLTALAEDEADLFEVLVRGGCLFT